MIIINVMRGGMGNQLFQWVISRAIEAKYNCEVFMDLTHLSGHGGITDRRFDLPQFPNLKLRVLDHDNFSRFLQKSVLELNEGNFDVNSTNLDLNLNYSLMGYWQNYIFLEGISDLIKKDLSCSEQKKIEFYKKYPELSSNTVSLHVRRTDYLTSNGFHPVQTISYYEKALEIIGEYDNLLIFSDDIDWCKNNMHFKNQIFVEGNLSSEDIWLMSLCNNNIIANSSFSWWGAWLNNNENKKVISPVNWFSTGDVPSMNLPGWIKI